VSWIGIHHHDQAAMFKKIIKVCMHCNVGVRGRKAGSIVTAFALWLWALGLGRHTKLITPPEAKQKNISKNDGMH
jgi:hypothetical protein